MDNCRMMGVGNAVAPAQNLRYSKGVYMAGITVSPTGTTLADLGRLTGGNDASCAVSAADASKLNASFDWIAAKTCRYDDHKIFNPQKALFSACNSAIQIRPADDKSDHLLTTCIHMYRILLSYPTLINCCQHRCRANIIHCHKKLWFLCFEREK